MLWARSVAESDATGAWREAAPSALPLLHSSGRQRGFPANAPLDLCVALLHSIPCDQEKGSLSVGAEYFSFLLKLPLAFSNLAIRNSLVTALSYKHR